MKIGKADASKNSKKINKFVQLKAPTKQISKSNIITQNNSMLTPEYHDVKTEIIKTNELKIRNGKFKLFVNSKRFISPSWNALG